MSTELNMIKGLYNMFEQSPFICTDTRKIIPNALFFCLKGENFDGNLFVNEALEKGAAYVITEKNSMQGSDMEYPLQFLKGCPKGGVVNIEERIIVVDNVLQTLQQLAHFHRKQLKIPVIGITGTNGKTTTKELIASVLSKKYKTAFTQGNFNNHIGVPLTLLSIKNEDEIAVIEMGANHPGEIEKLCQIAQPDIGLITNIGKAHLEGFGSIENIIETKTALYRSAPILFINNEDKILIQKAVLRQCSATEKKKIIYYGNDTEISGQIIEMNPYLVINLFNKKIQTQLTGNYNFSNILAAAAIGKYFGISQQDICDAIAEYAPQNNRSQIIKNKTHTIIADYYNANPTSVKAALDNFLQIEAPHKLAIVGDMLELGENSASEHQAVIDFCEENDITSVFIGEIFYSLKNNRFLFFKNVAELNHYINSLPSFAAQKLILIKGSRGVHLENISLFR